MSRLFVLIGRGRDTFLIGHLIGIGSVCRQQNNLKDPERRWPGARQATEASEDTKPASTLILDSRSSFPLSYLHVWGLPCFLSHLSSSTSSSILSLPQEKGRPEHHPGILSLSRFGRVSESRMKCGRMNIICIVWLLVYSQRHMGLEFCQMPCRHLWI